ncbi:MAG: replication restart helicase PriA, partial [Balneolaceae bacterium]
MPSGLNFVSKTYVRVGDLSNIVFSEDEEFVLHEIESNATITQSEVQKRWRNTKYQKVFNRLLKSGAIELWEEPNIKTKAKIINWIDWGEDRNAQSAIKFLEGISKLTKWHQSLRILSDLTLPIKRSDFKALEGITDFTFNKLKQEGWINVIEKEETDYFDQLIFQPEKLKALNADQTIAFDAISKKIRHKKFENFLLYGITGSGKTEVYIHTLKECIENKKGGIVLVPEIALTPQTVARFYQIFGNKIAVLHSRMSNSERLAEWKSIENGSKQIVIGPRSAVFAPVQNLGAIILDEEHDSSYKQIDPAPRYHAREVAIMRASENNAIVLMGSATPSMQALNMVKQQKAKLLSLDKRHADATLPDVQIIDLTQYKGAMQGSMSVALFNAVKESLDRGEQAILLFNRRGFANYVQCETCGHIPKSPESSVSLTYHKRSNMLMCHYSGYARKLDKNCEMCGSDKLMIQGSGTQKIEEEVAELFPEARILRFDKDSTSKKGAHERILSSFGKKEADILVGTQLVSKGLDFPEVTTVGVIDADTEQAFPSFNASERLFQLLSQVAGRSGR